MLTTLHTDKLIMPSKDHGIRAQEGTVVFSGGRDGCSSYGNTHSIEPNGMLILIDGASNSTSRSSYKMLFYRIHIEMCITGLFLIFRAGSNVGSRQVRRGEHPWETT